MRIQNSLEKIVKILFILLCFGYINTACSAMRDPTAPPSSLLSGLTNQGSPFELTALITVDGHRMAVINNLILAEGDEIFGNKIISINLNSVQLEGINGKITLFLIGKPIKQPIL